MNDTGTVITLRREMGISHADFFRSLPAAIEPGSFRLVDDTVWIETPAGELQIRLSPQGERRIAALRLPVTVIEFSFPGWTQDRVNEFLARFDRYFRRGGG